MQTLPRTSRPAPAASDTRRFPFPGSAEDRVRDTPSELMRLERLLVAIRVVTLLFVGVLVATLDPPADGVVIAWSGVLAAVHLARLFQPLVAGPRAWTELAAECVATTVAVVTTGGWTSPFVILLVPAVGSAGSVIGTVPALAAALLPTAVVAISDSLTPGTGPEASATTTLRESLTWGAVLGLVALVSGGLRRVAEERRIIDRATIRRQYLENANELLSALHRLAQTLPASLDLGEVLDSTIGRLRPILPFDASAVLLHDRDHSHLTVAVSTGCSLTPELAREGLPDAVVEALATGEIVVAPSLRDGLTPFGRSALCLPLRVRNEMIGVLVLESRELNRYGESEAALAASAAESAALEIDNARYFARLRTVGADEERNRIARDLHDRIGQALAYLGFEIDRIHSRATQGEDVREGLARLREDQRSVVREVRDALYDLRSEVTESEPLTSVLAGFCRRVAERTGLQIEVDLDADLQLPARQERELWRIAQEAITNVERHAHARKVWVSWALQDGRAVLEINDDGQGFTSGRSGRSDSYGLLGIRERASSIGAALAVTTGDEGRGTRIRCAVANGHGRELSAERHRR